MVTIDTNVKARSQRRAEIKKDNMIKDCEENRVEKCLKKVEIVEKDRQDSHDKFKADLVVLSNVQSLVVDAAKPFMVDIV